MPDINTFWKAFKFSWLRRLILTRSFWPNILQDQIKDILGTNLTLIEVCQLGASKLSVISKQIKNVFWKQVFADVEDMMNGAAISNPDNLLYSPFFGRAYGRHDHCKRCFVQLFFIIFEVRI